MTLFAAGRRGAEFIYYHCSTTTNSGLIYLVGRFVSQCLMRPLAIVEGKVVRQPECQFDHGVVPIEVNIFMLDASPETFEDVVECPTPAIHADGDALSLEHTGKGITGEL